MDYNTWQERAQFDNYYESLEKSIKRFKDKTPSDRATNNFRQKLNTAIENGFPIDYVPRPKSILSYIKYPLLRSSIINGCNEFSSILLDAGANPNLIDHRKHNALDNAADFLNNNSDLNLFERILDMTENSDSIDLALSLVCRKLSYTDNICQAITLLLDAGADPKRGFRTCEIYSDGEDTERKAAAAKLKNLILRYDIRKKNNTAAYYDYEL